MTDRELVDLLKRKGLLLRAQVLDGGDLTISRIDRRNRNYRVEGVDRALFVKQGSDTHATGSVAREAAVYELLAEPKVHDHAGKYLARYLGHDPDARILILEALPGAEDLHEYHRRTRRFPIRLASELGGSLGAVHRATRSLAEGTLQAPFCSSSPLPWILRLPTPDLAILREASAINLKLIRLLQEQDAFEREFARLSAEWRSESLIHGDVKLENCLTYRARPKGVRRGLKWVDWEFAGLGDPRWDVGSLFASYLALWVFAIPMPKPDRPELLATSAAFPLSSVQTSMRSFFESYARAAALDTEQLRPWLETAVRMAGARLVQTAYEYAAFASELFAPVLTLLQLALNVLEQPERAAREVIGIR